jgi:hypothetical protein
MSNQPQINKPLKINLDKSKADLTDTEAFYLLNHERYVNLRGGKKDGASLGKSSPVIANYPACKMEDTRGETYIVGVFRSPITNELYSWHYNTSNVNYILRITDKVGCEVVCSWHTDDCFGLSADPKHFINGQFRAWLKVDKTCRNRHGKMLVWTDGRVIGAVDVEASIATNSFSTPFFDRCTNPCDPLLLCVPKPCECITAEWIPLSDQELADGLTSTMVDKPYKFMFRHIYYDGRASEWSNMSTDYFQNSKGCFDTRKGFSRCIRLRVPVGNALVEKIEIAYWKGGNTWYTTEVVEKYKAYNSSQQYWYERDLSEMMVNFSEEDCAFDYIFCDDKMCQEVDPETVKRVYNPFPRGAQGLIPIKDALGFFNYEDGTCPVDKHQAVKLDVEMDCESGGVACDTEYATVTVRAVIHKYTRDKNQFIYRLREGGEDDDTDTAMFGGLNHWDNVTSGGFENAYDYDQFFNGKIRNFQVYVEGTNIFAEMKQWRADRHFNNRVEVGVLSGMEKANTRKKYWRELEGGNFYYQEAKIRVRKGTKGFLRLVNHHELTGAGASQNTSTFVKGTLANINMYNGEADIDADTTYDRYEIYFDTCNGDVEVQEVFVIEDNAVDRGMQKKASAYHGYITDKNGRPVEGVYIATQTIGGYHPVSVTDHNGFYHFYFEEGTNNPVTFYVFGEKDCNAFSILHQFIINGEAGTNVQSNNKIEFTNYENQWYATVRAVVKDCNGQGIGGVRVAVSGSKYGVTAPNGIADIRIRNYAISRQGSVRYVRAVVMDYNGCFGIDCADNCYSCMPDRIESTPYCYDTNPIINIPDFILNRESADAPRMGLKKGGRYGFAFVLEGDCGYLTDPFEIKYLNMPRVQKDGNLRYCGFKWKDNGFIAPPEAKCLKILRTKNQTPFELQWIVDKVERISGNRIRLTIQSLNDYNAQYNFKTNTVYKWLQDDRIEFIRNGDGKVFDVNVHGVLNYQTLSPFHDVNLSQNDAADANYFNQLLIEDDGKLDTLKEGAIIEMQRSPECNDIPAYYEIPCATIPIVDGKLLYPTGVFYTHDTYVVVRQIGSNPSMEFEHHTPSDFWADRLDDLGRGHAVNKYADKLRKGRNLTLNAPNQYNYFSGDTVKTFDCPEHGDIVAMFIWDGRYILAIGEHDNFLAQAADDLLRVGADGTIRAASGDQVVSNAEPKLAGRYGCSYQNVQGIFFGDGYAMWPDTNNHDYIIHDFSSAKPIATSVSESGSVETQVRSYWSRRMQEMETYNRSEPDVLNHYRFVIGYNTVTTNVMITIKRLRDSGVMNEKAPYIKPNETLLYNPKSNDVLTFLSFTPEAYGNIDLFDGKGCAFIAYLQGNPYIHPIIPEKWNEFFGQTVDRMIGVSINKFRHKVKTAISLEVKDETMWFVAEVTTDDPNFISEIPPINFEKEQDQNWNAAFLFNKNWHGGLYGEDPVYGGEPARGYEINVLLIRDNTDALKYGTIDPTKRVKFDELDLIMFKFAINEQSGFSENL